ncbi:hypothetical protein HanIR_Chr10g0463911 [Helianthus annuus]|nr:hypothetical protein HanIR_Chr10g0463911 [Helianthus annuus]
MQINEKDTYNTPPLTYFLPSKSTSRNLVFIFFHCLFFIIYHFKYVKLFFLTLVPRNEPFGTPETFPLCPFFLKFITRNASS